MTWILPLNQRQVLAFARQSDPRSLFLPLTKSLKARKLQSWKIPRKKCGRKSHMKGNINFALPDISSFPWLSVEDGFMPKIWWLYWFITSRAFEMLVKCIYLGENTNKQSLWLSKYAADGTKQLTEVLTLGLWSYVTKKRHRSDVTRNQFCCPLLPPALDTHLLINKSCSW